MPRYDEGPWNTDVPFVTVLSERVCKARKQHQCLACGESIEPNTIYYRICYIDDDGKFKVDRCHTRYGICPKHMREEGASL